MSYTLLLADDSATIQRVVELSFAKEDISVVAFSDGDNAIKSIDKTHPDIVLADIGMPGRNGYEVARHIKGSPSLAHIPVLLLTGAFEPVDPVRANEAGCDGVLIKPFEPEVVVNRVKQLLSKPKQASRTDDVESYFEELDQAFANLAAAGPSPRPRAETGAAPPATESSTAPAVRPPLPEAFAALLTAERTVGPDKSAQPSPVLRSRATKAASPEMPTGELIEQVVQRVLERLSDAVVREAVTGIVHDTAERLVREEIERIKSNIK